MKNERNLEKHEKPAIATKLIAGGIAGASETMVTYPAEFVKTRRQLPQFTGKSVSSLSIFQSTYRNFGLSGFYSGCTALAASNSLKSGIRFLSFEISKDYLDRVFHTIQGQRNPWVNVLAGLSAGIAESILAVTPGEALKTRLIEDAASTGRGRFAGKGVSKIVRMVVREEGVGAFWKGTMPVLSKQATNSAVRFTSFGMMQEQISKIWPSLDGNIGATLAVGAMSGVITVCVSPSRGRELRLTSNTSYASMPFDNIKTRIQSTGGEYTGMLDCAIKIMEAEGLSAFWRGTSPRLMRLTLSSGITFAVYDQVVRSVRSFRMDSPDRLQI